MIGCRLNQAEIDQMARQFEAQGHEIVEDPAQAEQFVVNTCAVTNEATRTSRKLIRELNRASPAAQTTVTGCYAQIAPDDIAVLPGVASVVANDGKDTLVSGITGVPVEDFDHEPVARDSARSRTRAFVKVQDGCDNACTFCVTTVARGDGQSRLIADVVAEIQQLHKLGYQEAILTGVHLGSFGHDRGEYDGLARLIQTILTNTTIPRLRLSSLEPWDLSADFFTLWQDSRLCRHLHLPLQSGCDRTLKRMRRNTTQAEFRALVQEARQQIPGLSITSDVIVGFPGETEDEFAESLAFIREMVFAGLHVFRYSQRPGTPAARMRGHLPNDIKKHRSQRLRGLSETLAQGFAEQFIGHRLDVLWEQVTGASEDGFHNVGYTDNYIRVACTHPRPLNDQITPARGLSYDARHGHLIVDPILTESED
jgi:threonylcarbamoyladenosine tRNA methylthiotransferase MtaB